MRYLMLFFFWVSGLSCLAQPVAHTLENKDLGEGKLARRVSFDGNSLWGYINGGADIYLEYGFKSLNVHEVEFRNNLLRFDLYQMKDSKAAYGIFSVYSYRCDSTAGHGEFNCATRWQIQSVKGEYYLSVILPTGSPEEYTYGSALAEALLSSIETEPFEPGFPFLPDTFRTIKGKIQYCRGPLGLDNGIAFNSKHLKQGSFTDLWHITGISGYKNTDVSVITFDSADDADSFIGQSEEGPEIDNTIFLFQLNDGKSLVIIEGAGTREKAGIIVKWFSR